VLGRIEHGERPAGDEIQRQWANLIGEARSRFDTLREQINRRRRGRSDKPQPP
jgi:hypothetical protein